MCFVKLSSQKDEDFLIAEEDIIVWKRLIPLVDNYVSPYKYFKYSVGSTYRACLNKTAGVYDTKNGRDIYYTKVDEGLHSYLTLEGAKYLQLVQEQVVKMIIPKGSRYMVEEDQRTPCREVVSDCLYFPQQ